MKTYKLLWIPRILTIIFILFISIFALDAFQEGAAILEQIGGFLIHLIPSFVLIVLLVVSWNRPLYRGIVFLVISMIFTIFFKTYRELPNFLIVSLPLIIVGVLFITVDLSSWKRIM